MEEFTNGGGGGGGWGDLTALALVGELVAN